jgi:hypothetical protein
MKTNRFTSLVAAVFGLVAFSSISCTAKDVATTTVTTAVPGPNTTVQVVTTVSSDDTSAKWFNIQDYTYDMRVPFFAGLKQLEARVDGEISELAAKRATMNGTADTKDWDFSMKEMENSRTYLRSMGEELSKATSETWNQEKDKVGQAWVRTQEAYHKVKSSTTS